MPSETRNRFLLLYGSQTGQAKAIAEEVHDKSEQFGLHAELHCISYTEKKFNLERERCVVFVVSTTGDGEPPDTVQKFWRRLNKRTLPDTHLQHLHYSLLGLGDTNYTNFCKCGKSLDRRLEQLGAKRFFPCAWADDGVGLEVAAEPWIDNVIPAVREFLGLPAVVVKSVEWVSKGDNYPVSHLEAPSVQCDTAQSNGQSAADNKVENDTKADLTESQTADINMSELSGHGSDRTAIVNTSHTLDSSDSRNSQNTSEFSGIGNSLAAAGSNAVDGYVPGGKVLNEPMDVTLSLTSPSPELRDYSLTVPLLSPPFLCLTFTDQTSENLEDLPYQNGSALPSAASPVTMATVVCAKRLTQEDAVKTALNLELKFDVSVCDTVPPGDAISVMCPNPHHEVSQLLDRLNLTDVADQLFELSVMPDTKKRRAAIPDHIPPKSSLRHILTTCVDIRQPPKKALLRVLLEFTSNPIQRRRLQELCSKQGGQLYTQFIHGPGLSILDLLTAFPSCSPTAVRLLEHLPRLQPRPYSVASSPLVHPGQLRIVFNIIEISAGEGRCARRGVCTGWLDDITGEIQVYKPATLENQLTTLTLEENSQIQIPVFARTNQNFHMPEDLSIPLIMIGPGTGVAPFVGYLQHREFLLKETTTESVGDTWLFYGCRHKDRDFLFREELERLREVRVLSELCVSFSRDEDRGDNNRYVQDNLQSHGPALIELIEEKAAVIFVCGDAKNMAKTVNDMFVDLYQSCKDLSAGDARSKVMSLRLARRYLEDVWT
ncbi:LOW QUALITY PROTEIN: methionine synthase reductase-like [Liolophura sinensis]|uniref:LOW QUALITY PROTEIN: methionine synthase reductase-like n=1 Tax=Liolophura sinensis TaxID=3198878 RepID=UPI0031595936